MLIDLESFLSEGFLISLSVDTVCVGWGKSTLHRKPPSKEIPALYLQDFFLTKTAPWSIYPRWSYFQVKELSKILQSKASHKPSLHFTNACKPVFINSLEDLKKRFLKNELLKAVPYVVEKAEHAISHETLAYLLLNAIEKNHLLHSKIYGRWSALGGILGNTPENLFSLSIGKNLTTHALAGTGSSQISLDSIKNRNEHQIVIQGIEESLKSLGIVHLHPTTSISLGSLFHLQTMLSLDSSSNLSFEEAVTRLHPTPALGAFPKEAGSNWLSAYNKCIERHSFGAPIGISHEEIEECYVAIRNIQWTPKELLIMAGCGVVKESDPEDEWNEILMKLNSIHNNLGI